MPNVSPFRAVQFRGGVGDVSELIAPPYDVLDTAGKSELLAKNTMNIVRVDLPHTPAKELGPPAAYASAGEAYRAMLREGTLARREQPVMFAYRQTFASAVKTIERCGMTCCVDAVPLGPRAGGGVLPHEETFSGPKEDRFALMKATRAQLSPVFGLHADEKGVATALVRAIMARGKADMSAVSGEGVRHEVWTVKDGADISAYQAALAGEDVFIADGHHRYSTGLSYIKHVEAEAGKAMPADHPARKCMMVLVSMSDPGLVIWPTHRVLGGMSEYSFDAFVSKAGAHIRLEPVLGGLHAINKALHEAERLGERRFGLYDFASERGGVAVPSHPDPLAARFPERPRAWRDLSVAFCQYVIVEEVCRAGLNGGRDVRWAFPHTTEEVGQIGSGEETGAGGGKGFAQLAVLVRPTPLGAVRDVSRANQLMPQKSTFFYPKLATGLFVHALEA